VFNRVLVAQEEPVLQTANKLAVTWSGTQFVLVGNVDAVKQAEHQIAESAEHAAKFAAVLAKAEKRFVALAKVEQRHALAYQQVLETVKWANKYTSVWHAHIFTMKNSTASGKIYQTTSNVQSAVSIKKIMFCFDFQNKWSNKRNLRALFW
jgi:rubrerythrin